MPFGRRRNRIDRSLRERGVPPEPQAPRARGRRRPPARGTRRTRPTTACTRIDLGALRLPARPGMELRVDLNQQQKVVGATLRSGDSLLQVVGVRRAARRRHLGRRPRRPRDERLRPGRLAARGRGAVRHASWRAPSSRRRRPRPGSPRPQPVRRPARFLGVDGPRWFLRGMISGPAASSPEAAAGWRRPSAPSSSSAGASPCRSGSSCR